MFVLELLEGEKSEYYPRLIGQLKALLQDETDFGANLANTASLLYHLLPEINWAGFYLYKGDQLVLGPFHGKPACTRIPLGKGVCGTAAHRKETIVVPDVHAFPGHIACDAASRSEIVVPMFDKGSLIGVLDIDSPVKNRFDQTDKTYLEQIAELVCSRSRVAPK
jgi:GAF domain-containing protein